MTPEETILPFEDEDDDVPSFPGEDPSFEALDPGWTDPGYWARFQERTLALVEPELVRRRRVGERITVSEVVTSWSRALVPVAMAAAAVAVTVLLAHPEESGAPATQRASVAEAPVDVEQSEEPAPPERSEGLEDGRVATLDGGPLLTLDDSGPAEMSVVLTAAVEGF